jgi:hypothetical protein
VPEIKSIVTAISKLDTPEPITAQGSTVTDALLQEIHRTLYIETNNQIDLLTTIVGEIQNINSLIKAQDAKKAA